MHSLIESLFMERTFPAARDRQRDSLREHFPATALALYLFIYF
jgi:hypothetical protein